MARKKAELTRSDNKICVEGARVHNLKNVDVEIPRDSLTVITGLSGSGKSSLAFDTIYAEGQRRYIETFSAYARNFMGNQQEPSKHGWHNNRNLRLPSSAIRKDSRSLFLR